MPLLETTLFFSGFSSKDPHSHSNCIYHVTELGLGTKKDEVTVEQLSAAIPDVISLTLEDDEDVSYMEEVDYRAPRKLISSMCFPLAPPRACLALNFQALCSCLQDLLYPVLCLKAGRYPPAG